MSRIRQMLGGFSDEHRVEGTSTEQREVHEADVRAARLAAARRHSLWSELDGPALVWRQGVRAYVHADTDALYRLHPGEVFAPGTANPLAENAGLSFYASAEGEVVFLERLTSPATYTEHQQRQAEHERRQGVRV